jgi:hypothetical protein
VVVHAAEVEQAGWDIVVVVEILEEDVAGDEEGFDSWVAVPLRLVSEVVTYLAVVQFQLYQID